MHLNIDSEDKNIKEQTSLSISTEEIIKSVKNSQRIEGYNSVSSEVTKRLKALMKKHNVEVSF